MPLETRMRSTVSSMLSPMKKIRAATKGRGPQMRQRLAVPSAESSAEDNNTQFKGNQKAAYWSNEPKFSKSSAEDNNTIFKGNQKAVYWSNESKCSKSSAEENNT